MMSVSRLLAITLLLLLTLAMSDSQSTAAKPQSAKKDCATATPADIVKSIYEKISTKYPQHNKQINVTFKDGVVRLRGWVPSAAKKKDIEKIAKQTSCVKSVDSKLGTKAPMGCGPGQKQCGTICIPENENCNIVGR